MDGKDLEILHKAFLAAYDTSALESLLRFRLNRRLDSLVNTNASLETVLFQLLTRAEREGWLRELIEQAATERSGNTRFVAVCQEILGPDVVDQTTDATPQGNIDAEATLLPFLEGLTPADFARILTRLPAANPYVPEGVSHYARVAALLSYVRSSAGPGIGRLAAVVKELFPAYTSESSHS